MNTLIIVLALAVLGFIVWQLVAQKASGSKPKTGGGGSGEPDSPRDDNAIT